MLKNKGIYGPGREKTCLQGFVNNKGADQPAHAHSLISAFAIHLLESIISETCYELIFNFLTTVELQWLEQAWDYEK